MLDERPQILSTSRVCKPATCFSLTFFQRFQTTDVNQDSNSNEAYKQWVQVAQIPPVSPRTLQKKFAETKWVFVEKLNHKNKDKKVKQAHFSVILTTVLMVISCQNCIAPLITLFNLCHSLFLCVLP